MAGLPPLAEYHYSRREVATYGHCDFACFTFIEESGHYIPHLLLGNTLHAERDLELSQLPERLPTMRSRREKIVIWSWSILSELVQGEVVVRLYGGGRAELRSGLLGCTWQEANVKIT